MKTTTTLPAAVAIVVAAALVPVPASSQTPAQKELPQAERTFNLTLEQRYTIKEILKDEKVERAAGNVDLKPGDIVPAGTPLHEMPPVIAEKVPQIKSHQFFLEGDKIVIVDPKEKKVAEVID
jgi:hypothetical protein